MTKPTTKFATALLLFFFGNVSCAQLIVQEQFGAATLLRLDEEGFATIRESTPPDTASGSVSGTIFSGPLVGIEQNNASVSVSGGMVTASATGSTAVASSNVLIFNGGDSVTVNYRASVSIGGFITGNSSASAFSGIFEPIDLMGFAGTETRSGSFLLGPLGSVDFFTSAVGGAESSGTASIVFGTGTLPGEDPGNGIDPTRSNPGQNGIYVPGGPDAGEVAAEGGPEVANDTSGGYLTTLPIGDDYGVTDPVFIAGSGPSDAGDSQPNANAYFFSATNGIVSNEFTSFTTPNGITGDTSDIFIEFDGSSVPYVPGTTFDFPAGVSFFTLSGLDQSAQSSVLESAAFVHGFTFADAGSTAIFQVPFVTTAVPEPFSVTCLSIGLLSVGMRRRR